ncbi:MAG: shikimate dehydrogenase, partial [Candidatus Cloacimonetes bacterium]|nr:shikimate dehydrogenase [Candidatus Cloacimonadota bacterium]
KAQSLSDVISSNTDCRAHAIRFTSGLVIPQDTDILINATCIGLAPASDKRPDIDFDSIKKGMVVSDVVFCPADSLFLKAARERGAVCVNGLGMLVCQGVLAFELWTGIKAPQTVMAEALAKEMN